MHFQLLAIFLLLSSGLSFANGRSPAVEDFVGIEVDQPDTPHGSEVLYNLEKDVSKIETVRKEGPVEVMAKEKAPEQSPWSPSAFFGIAFILGLPFLTWSLIMHHLRRKAIMESASNIEVLEKYRREREEAKKKDDVSRKVS